MKKDEFAHSLLQLWMTTAIPLTLAGLQYHTGATRKQVRKWTEQMIRDGELEMDSDPNGDLVVTVPGAARPANAPRTFAELEKKAGSGKPGMSLARLGDAQTALSIAGSARRELEGKRPSGDKSLLWSGGLSLLLGPLGWLYAGSFREAVPAALATLIAFKLIPMFLLMPLLPFLMPLSAVAGVVYAWQHNRSGHRTPILGDDKQS